jgi:hypothetical protein
MTPTSRLWRAISPVVVFPVSDWLKSAGTSCFPIGRHWPANGMAGGPGWAVSDVPGVPDPGPGGAPRQRHQAGGGERGSMHMLHIF